MPLFRSKPFENRSQRGLYGDAVEEIDWNVGRILDTLRELKLEEDTLVLYMSDNGPWAPYLEQGGSAGLLRGAKGSTWEGGMRIPAIFWWPGTIKSSVTTGIGSELDILRPSRALRVPRRRPIECSTDTNLSQTLRGRAPSPRHTLFYYANSGNGILSAVRRDSFKAFFVVPPADTAGHGRRLRSTRPSSTTSIRTHRKNSILRRSIPSS